MSKLSLGVILSAAAGLIPAGAPAIEPPVPLDALPLDAPVADVDEFGLEVIVIDRPVLLDYTIRVAPYVELLAAPPGLETEIDLKWPEMTWLRLDEAQPPPPVAPSGLEGAFWAVANPAQGWRIVFPIPPEQAPLLVLPAAHTLAVSEALLEQCERLPVLPYPLSKICEREWSR